jgi:outer membrane protein OmpA-like peptidoglycan-associated protein
VAAKLTPTDLYEAKKALDKADQEFAAHGSTLECLDYAYIAHRKIELTDVKARTELDRQRIAEAATAGVLVRDTQVKTTQAALASTRTELTKERQDNKTATAELRNANNLQGKELATTVTQLEAEKQGRLSAEGKLAGAMKDLAAVAAVKEETRGVVITLSGSVLFASAKYDLLNTAMTKLDQVADALKAQDPDKRMVVEGHTDSTGSERTNQALSLNRASSVRDYLVSRGVASEKITAVGMSSSKPIADNKTAENRANNRRVEIVISTPPLSVR